MLLSFAPALPHAPGCAMLSSVPGAHTMLACAGLCTADPQLCAGSTQRLLQKWDSPSPCCQPDFSAWEWQYYANVSFEEEQCVEECCS